MNIATAFCQAFTVTMVFLLPGLCSAESVRIGYIGALTGDSAMLGSEIMRSIEVAVSDANASGGIDGRQIELVAEDDGYEVTRAMTAYEKLRPSINSNIIFMSTYGAIFALGERPVQHGIVIVDTLDCNEDIVKVSGMHTCVATKTESIGDVFVEAIERRGSGLAAVLHEDEAWFNFVVNTVREKHQGGLVEVVVPVKASDYRTELVKIKARNPKHIVFLGNDSMGRALAQSRQLGISAQFYTIAGATSPGFQALAGPALNGTVISNWLIPETNRYRDFKARFKAKHGQDPQMDFVVGPSADAGRLVLDTLRKDYLQHKSFDGARLRAALPEQPAFEGISGSIKMDPDGAVRSIIEHPYIHENGSFRRVTAP